MEETKKTRKFYILPVLYVLSAYLAVISFFMGRESPLFSLMVITPFIFGILNIIMCIRCCKPGYCDIMLSSAAIVKYCLIPFFITGGFIAVCSFISGILFPIPPMFIVGTSIALILCVGGWLVVAFGAPYTISYLVLSQREGRTSKGMAVIHIILQFFFTLDVIDILFLSFKARRNIKASVAVIVLLAITLIALVFLVLSIILQMVL